jgi:phosphatidate phosphatase APP1
MFIPIISGDIPENRQGIAMPFLILTRTGFDDLVSRVDLAGAVLHVNPGIASADEIAGLRGAGATVNVLASLADPRGADAVEHALALPDHEGEPVWVERVIAEHRPATPVIAPQSADPQSASQGRLYRVLHHRLTKSAGVFASGALRRLRNPEAGRRLMVAPYFGLGNASRIWVKGRVLAEHIFKEQTGEDSRWSNLVALYHRLETDEVAGARVCARFQGQFYETVTDRGGYFTFELASQEQLGAGWHNVELELPEHQAVRAVAHTLVPAPTARFGIISDIDDTVLWTNVTNKLNMALMLARSNAHTRKPFKGVAAFYRALNQGAGGDEDNPVFYVSSSPWHLFEPLVQFMRVQGIPIGPLLLRELGVREVFKLSNHRNHKLDKIELILRFYPGMQFVLIGDSGEQDPEIYAEVVRRHPEAVRMIYIRSVTPDPARIEALDRLIEEVKATGAQLILAPDSVFAASHAAAAGLIGLDALALVRSDKKHDDKSG